MVSVTAIEISWGEVVTSSGTLDEQPMRSRIVCDVLMQDPVQIAQTKDVVLLLAKQKSSKAKKKTKSKKWLIILSSNFRPHVRSMVCVLLLPCCCAFPHNLLFA